MSKGKNKSKKSKVLVYSVDLLVHILVIFTFLTLFMPVVFVTEAPSVDIPGFASFLIVMFWVALLSIALLLAEVAVERVLKPHG